SRECALREHEVAMVVLTRSLRSVALHLGESLVTLRPMYKSAEFRHIPMLAFLKDRDLKALSEDITEAQYEKGQYIFKEGDPTECFHVLTKGAVKCVKSSQGGKEAVLKMLLPGDLFCCEAAVFDGKPHPGCAQPMGPVTV